MMFRSIPPLAPFERSLSRITLIFQLMGIQYFSLKPETGKTNDLSRKFKLIFVANIALTISEFCGILFAMHLEKIQNKHGNAATGQIVQFTSFNFMIVVLVTTILNSFILRETAEQIFKNYKIISKTLLTLNHGVDYGTFVAEFKKSFVTLSIAFIASTCGTLILLSQCCHFNVFFWTFLGVYPYFFIAIVFSYWILLIRLIRENLRFVKECLVQLHKLNHYAIVERNHEIYTFIAKLKRTYGIIYETTLLINKLIAAPICLIIVLIVIGNVSSGYKVFLSFRNDIPMERVAFPIYTIFITFTILCALIFSCSSTYTATDDVLTQLLRFECSKLERKYKISAILSEFSMQIAHRPIKFKVGGFYCLTQPLLATIITGVLTYVMLLIQFATS